MTEIIPYLIYRDLPAAIDFLSRAFGFVETLRVATPSGGTHAELGLDGQSVMMGQIGPAASGGEAAAGLRSAMGVFVYLDDVDAHYDRAAKAGAAIEQTPHDASYGRTYTARDPEGTPWYFTQKRAP